MLDSNYYDALSLRAQGNLTEEQIRELDNDFCSGKFKDKYDWRGDRYHEWRIACEVSEHVSKHGGNSEKMLSDRLHIDREKRTKEYERYLRKAEKEAASYSRSVYRSGHEPSILAILIGVPFFGIWGVLMFLGIASIMGWT